MRIDETYEYKRIVSLLEGIQYSRDNPRLNHFYHKGFLIAVLEGRLAERPRAVDGDVDRDKT